eukprot:2908999-Alexandrium_andersonii.AAC.1
MGTVSSESDLILDPCGGGGGTSVPMGVASGGNGDSTGVGMDATGMDAFAGVHTGGGALARVDPCG